MSLNEIDCAAFIRLTGANLGDIGIHEIGIDGIKSSINGDTLSSYPYSPETNARLLDSIKLGRLIFPTTPALLFAWYENNKGDLPFTLPEWFISCVKTPAKSSEILAIEKLNIEQALIKLSAQRPLSPLKRFEVQTEREQLEGHLNLLDSATKWFQKPKRQSSDLVDLELREVMISLGSNATPASIFSALSKRAGQPGSCFTEALPDALIWKRPDGSLDKLAMPALRMRKKRARERNRS